MRGKAEAPKSHIRGRRITPAYAGKSVESAELDGSEIGSPPRMRGKDIVALDVAHGVGITPAYAGKSKGEV